MSNISKNLTDARKQVCLTPTEGQIHAGNYAKGHVKILGFNITIENPKGSYRKGKDKDGHEWKTLMHNDYGYFVRTLGKDGDAIDVFIGPNLKSEKIYPIDQFVNGEFDETKVMLGFDSKEEAKSAYLSNYEKNWKGFKYITEIDLDTFKKWLYDGYRQRKPFAKYVTLTESKHKVVKNDEGKIVPEKCDKCGSDVVVQIHGEPVYICKKCGKYFGTVPFKRNLNEEWGPVQDAWEDYSCSDLLFEFLSDKENGIKQKQWNVIPAEQYHNLLRRYMENPNMARIPNIVKKWMDEIIIKNTLSINYITELAGHSQGFPYDDCESAFGEEIAEKLGDDFGNWCNYLDSLGFYEWCSLPDGSDGWSDYGLQPIYKILNEYNYDTSPEDTLILINRVLDVYHCRGDLASAFIEGGSNSCNYISNSIKENINIKKALKSLKKRRDPDNIENWDNMINEDFLSPLLAKYAKEHGGLKVGRNGGLRDGVRAYHGGSKIDPAKVTDDMIYGEPYKYDWQNHTEDEYNNSIHFADNYAVMLKPYNHKRDDNINVPAQRKKPSRYYSGVGDTGDHDKSRGGFVGNGKDVTSAPYNGFSVSNRAGEAQHYREALKNNRNDINYIQNHKEKYDDWQKRVRQGNNNIEDIKRNSKNLLNKPRTINESQLRQIIRESIEEFYKGSQNEKAAYENACDCLYYGYGFKFWFDRNAQLLNNDMVIAKTIWKQAIEDMGNE